MPFWQRYLKASCAILFFVLFYILIKRELPSFLLRHSPLLLILHVDQTRETSMALLSSASELAGENRNCLEQEQESVPIDHRKMSAAGKSISHRCLPFEDLMSRSIQERCFIVCPSLEHLCRSLVERLEDKGLLLRDRKRKGRRHIIWRR